MPDQREPYPWKILVVLIQFAQSAVLLTVATAIGLEAAMVSHFTADLVLHVLGPLLKA